MAKDNVHGKNSKSEPKKFKIIYGLFHIVCMLATLSFISHCIHRYFLDEDVSQVTFEEFHKDEQSVYPSLALCISFFFYEDQLKMYGGDINVSTYTSYLSGDLWDDRMPDIDYDNVTLNFEDFFYGANMWTPDWKHLNGEERFIYDHRKEMMGAANETAKNQYGENNWTMSMVPKFYVSFRGGDQKCMSVDIPNVLNQKVWLFGIMFDSEMFPNQTRPEHYEFGIKFHYPGQFLRAPAQKYVWRSHEGDNPQYYTMSFSIQKMEIVRNRNKPSQNCNQNWQQDDAEIMKEKMKSLGCTPSHWKTDEEFQKCTTKEQMKLASEFDLAKYHQPCQSIRKLLFSYEEHELLEDWLDTMNESSNIFEAQIEFQDNTYMEIRQVREYGIQSVVGDSGGYIGLFLGFALLQTPEILMNTYSLLKQYLLRNKTKPVYKKSTRILPCNK